MSLNKESKNENKDVNSKEETTIKKEVVAITKMDLATQLYAQLLKKDAHITRKDIIDAFVKKCNLTPAGAATYYVTIKKRFNQKTEQLQ